MKYYEILPTHTETPRNTTCKIANLYIELNYHFLTLQKKIPLLLNRSVHNAWFNSNPTSVTCISSVTSGNEITFIFMAIVVVIDISSGLVILSTLTVEFLIWKWCATYLPTMGYAGIK